MHGKLGARRDQVAHCPRLATGASHRHPTPCVWMRHQAPPYLARAGLKHAVPHSPRVSESVSPARLTGGATTRLRGREKFKSFPFSSENKCGEVLAESTHSRVLQRGHRIKSGEVWLTPEALHEAAVREEKRDQSLEQKI